MSASFDLKTCLVRVCNAKGETKGTGFVVETHRGRVSILAVTCAHVITACGVAPGGRVRVVFHANGEARDAEVLHEFWRAPNADDVAVLRLDMSLPAGVTPATLGSTRACSGHPIRTAGFAELPGGYEFAWAKGESRGVVPHPHKRPMLQMRAEPIRRGMSGAPVFDLDTQRVVGMVNEFMPDAPLEWATTSETLAAVCPDLTLHPPQDVEDYLAAVREYCASLPYLSLHDIRPPKTLDEVYVPLKAQPQPREREEKTEPQERESLRPLSIAEVLQRREHTHLLILGEPGAGKSTCSANSPSTLGMRRTKSA